MTFWNSTRGKSNVVTILLLKYIENAFVALALISKESCREKSSACIFDSVTIE